MCNLSDGIEERGIIKGRAEEKGRKNRTSQTTSAKEARQRTECRSYSRRSGRRG